MGGIIIFLAFTVPYLVLSTRNWASFGVFATALACALLGLADDYTKIVRKRSLGLRARTKLGVTILISLGLWYIATRRPGVSSTVRPGFSTSTSTWARSTRCSSTSSSPARRAP